MPTATKATRARVSLTPLPSLADADLVRRARDGDERAFEEIVRRYRAPLIRYSARHVGKDHAEDVTQHALSKAAVHLREDPRPIHLRAWLYRVAHNAAINMRTRKDWGHEELSPDIDGVPQPPEIAAQRGEVRQVVSDLDRLPDRQRTALLLSVFEGLGYDEIASRLDTSPNSVRALLSRARAQLRKGAAALAPLPLIHALWRKVWGFANAAGGEGGVAAGGGVVQAKMIAIAATTVVAGAATAGRANSQDRDPAAARAPGRRRHPPIEAAGASRDHLQPGHHDRRGRRQAGRRPARAPAPPRSPRAGRGAGGRGAARDRAAARRGGAAGRAARRPAVEQTDKDPPPDDAEPPPDGNNPPPDGNPPPEQARPRQASSPRAWSRRASATAPAAPLNFGFRPLCVREGARRFCSRWGLPAPSAGMGGDRARFQVRGSRGTRLGRPGRGAGAPRRMRLGLRRLPPPTRGLPCRNSASRSCCPSPSPRS